MAITSRQVRMDCESCPDSINVMCSEHHGMFMCADCIAREAAVVPSVPQQETTMLEAIETKNDIFVSDTVSLVELRGRIYADASIADDMKEYEYVKAGMARMQHFQKVQFDALQTANEAGKQAKAWQTDVQRVIGTLRPELRAQFVSQDSNYQPTAVKTTKPKTVKVKTDSGSAKERAEVNAAAEKYGVPVFGVRMTKNQRNISADAAARILAEMMGLPVTPGTK